MSTNSQIKTFFKFLYNNNYFITASPEILNAEFEKKTTFDSLPISWQVSAHGVPRPEGQWLLNGNVVKSSDRVRITESGETYKIEIVDVIMADMGEWSFVAKNRLGEKRLTADLEVIRMFKKTSPTVEY